MSLFSLFSWHFVFCNLDFLALKPSNGLIKFLNNSWLIIWEFVLKEKTYNSRKLSTNETLIFILDNGLKLIKQISATTTDYVDWQDFFSNNGLKLIRRISRIIISAICVIRLNPLFVKSLWNPFTINVIAVFVRS